MQKATNSPTHRHTETHTHAQQWHNSIYFVWIWMYWYFFNILFFVWSREFQLTRYFNILRCVLLSHCAQLARFRSVHVYECVCVYSLVDFLFGLCVGILFYSLFRVLFSLRTLSSLILFPIRRYEYICCPARACILTHMHDTHTHTHTSSAQYERDYSHLLFCSLFFHNSYFLFSSIWFRWIYSLERDWILLVWKGITKKKTRFFECVAPRQVRQLLCRVQFRAGRNFDESILLNFSHWKICFLFWMKDIVFYWSQYSTERTRAPMCVCVCCM